VVFRAFWALATVMTLWAFTSFIAMLSLSRAGGGGGA